MSGLSNIFRWRDASSRSIDLSARPIRADETHQALRLLLGAAGEYADDAAVTDFADFARRRGMDLGVIWVAGAASRLLAACLPVISPGGTVLLMTSSPGSSRHAAQALAACVDAACGNLNQPDIQIAQLLLDPADHKTAEAMRRIAFQDLATLIYLQRTPTRLPPEPSLPANCRLLNYSAETHQHFARAILGSYEQSLDCPLLHGRRGIDDVIAGHQAAGDFDPNLWFCLLEQDVEQGVLLLSPVTGHDMMELVYIGLAPIARGKKLGDYFVDLALHRTIHAELSTLSLAVDSKNTPALRLYHRHGLAEIHRRRAMIRMLQGPCGGDVNSVVNDTNT